MAEKASCLLVIEGIDGSGKSTQVRLLRRRLRQLGVEVAVFREPTRGVWGKKIRAKAKKEKFLDPQQELELFIRDRQDNVERHILPALTAGKVVILDRYYFSTIAYQGARGIDPAYIRRRNEAFAPRPDAVFILHLPASEGLARIHHRRNKDILFEKKRYLEKVAEIFQGIRGRGIYHLDALQPRSQVHEAIFQKVQRILQRKGWLA